MPRPTTTMKYDRHMWRILDKLKADPTQPVVFRYPKRNQAKNMQLDFLSFRNAALDEGLHRGKTVQVPDQFDQAVWWRGGEFKEEFIPAKYPDLNAYRTRVRQAEDGMWELHIFHGDWSEEAKDARRQLGMEEPQPIHEAEVDEEPAYAKRPPKAD